MSPINANFKPTILLSGVRFLDTIRWAKREISVCAEAIKGANQESAALNEL